MHTPLSSLEPFEGPCGSARVTWDLDTHTIDMLDRLCKHYGRTRAQVVEEAIERQYLLDSLNLDEPTKDEWDIDTLVKLSRVVALWEAGHLRTYTFVPTRVIRPGTRRSGWYYERKRLEPGLSTL
jgi:hypothetical protein